VMDALPGTNIIHQKQKWLDHYESKPASVNRFHEATLNHAQFLATIWDVIVRRRIAEVVELGVGTGNLVQYLVARDLLPPVRHFVELDYNPHFLFSNQAIWGDNVDRIIADLHCLPMFCGNHRRRNRLIFHQGLLEHYDDEKIRDTVAWNLMFAQTVIFSVPSDRFDFPTGTLGDERFMPLHKWHEIFDTPVRWKHDYTQQITSFSYGRYPGEEYHHCFVMDGLSW
jgi:hypothetical protein